MEKIAEFGMRIAEMKKKIKARCLGFKSEIPLRNSMEFQGPKSRKSFRFLGGNPKSEIKRGFTLIELMAVVAIIMILTAIMVPNVVKSIERGKMGRATADIDILVKAVNLFQIDNGRLPSNLPELWTPPGGVSYISSDQAKSLATPWETTYAITGSSSSYTITAPGTGEGEIKVSKTITFGASAPSTP